MKPLAPFLAAIMVCVTGTGSGHADQAAGKRVFGKCKICHEVGDDAQNRIGPHLNGVFGRKAGSVEGFKYSKSMNRAGVGGLVWSAETLDTFTENPKALISKTRMSFRGLKDTADRENLLEYLRSFSDNLANTPQAGPATQPTDHDLDPAILALQGDREYGEYLASECLTCHRADGSSAGIPSITHWPNADFVIAMHAYKAKLRPHPVMQIMAGRLSNEEIAALAAYFENLE